MPEHINAEIVTVGTEILLGEITDTNSVHIARVMRDIGVNLFYMTSVGDNEKRIADVIRSGLSRSHVVIVAGGLGPTVDDVTRQGVAAAAGRELHFHQELFDQITARFAGFHVKMTENNRRQAYLPDGAVAIENPVGTAPSFIMEHEGSVVICLPGVPREMKYLMEHSVVPYLRQRYSLGVIKARVLHTAGIGESMLDDLIGTELLEMSNPTVGLVAHQGAVDVRITAKAGSENEADQLIDKIEAVLYTRIGKHIFGTDGTKLEDVLAELIQNNPVQVSFLEAGMENPAAALLMKTSRPNSIQSTHYSHPDDLRKLLHIESSVSIRDLAEQAARWIHQQSGSMVGVALLSMPDVKENTDQQQSTAIAIYSPQAARSRAYGFGAQSDLASDWIKMWTMSSLWNMLREIHHAE